MKETFDMNKTFEKRSYGDSLTVYYERNEEPGSLAIYASHYGVRLEGESETWEKYENIRDLIEVLEDAWKEYVKILEREVQAKLFSSEKKDAV